MANWYIVKNGKRLGPVDARTIKEQAQSGDLKPNDLVWREGLEKEVPASRIKGLDFSHATPISESSLRPENNSIAPAEVSSEIASKKTDNAVSKTRECSNCESKIGKLEEPQLWRGNMVCADCYATLSGRGKIKKAFDKRIMIGGGIAVAVLICMSIIVAVLLSKGSPDAAGGNAPAVSSNQDTSKQTEEPPKRQVKITGVAACLFGDLPRWNVKHELLVNGRIVDEITNKSQVVKFSIDVREGDELSYRAFWLDGYGNIGKECKYPDEGDSFEDFTTAVDTDTNEYKLVAWDMPKQSREDWFSRKNK